MKKTINEKDIELFKNAGYILEVCPTFKMYKAYRGDNMFGVLYSETKLLLFDLVRLQNKKYFR